MNKYHLTMEIGKIFKIVSVHIAESIYSVSP